MRRIAIIPETSASWPEALAKHKIPEQFQRGLTLYLTAGVRPGGFLTAVLRNDMMDAAVQAADAGSWIAAWAIMLLLVHEAPSKAWGSKVAVEGWIQERQQERMDAETDGKCKRAEPGA